MRRLALLSLVPAALALTAPALRPRARGQFLRSSPDDDEAPPEISEDFRDFRARLIARTKGEGLTEAGDERAVAEGWAYETPLLEAGCLLLGGHGAGLRVWAKAAVLPQVRVAADAARRVFYEGRHREPAVAEDGEGLDGLVRRRRRGGRRVCTEWRCYF